MAAQPAIATVKQYDSKQSSQDRYVWNITSEFYTSRALAPHPPDAVASTTFAQTSPLAKIARQPREY